MWSLVVVDSMCSRLVLDERAESQRAAGAEDGGEDGDEPRPGPAVGDRFLDAERCFDRSGCSDQNRRHHWEQQQREQRLPPPGTSSEATVGTLYGGLAAGARGRETLLPLLLLPVVAPVLIGATRAVEAALGTVGTTADGWPWLGLVAVFAVAFGVGGTLAFGPLIDT